MYTTKAGCTMTPTNTSIRASENISILERVRRDGNFRMIIITRLFPSVAKTDNSPLVTQMARRKPCSVDDNLKLASSKDSVESRQGWEPTEMFIACMLKIGWSLLVSVAKTIHVHVKFKLISIQNKNHLIELRKFYAHDLFNRNSLLRFSKSAKRNAVA